MLRFKQSLVPDIETLFDRLCLSLSQGQQMLSMKWFIVNTLEFSNHTVPMAANPLHFVLSKYL